MRSIKLRSILFSWFVLSLIGLGMIVAIITSYLPKNDPNLTNQVADAFVFVALYAGVFLFSLGLMIFAGYGLRWLRLRAVYPAWHWPVFRQASLIAIGLTALLALRGVAVLSWWDASLLIVALILVELSFRVRPNL